MAVSGVSGSGTSIYGSRNVLSGLASGMDTESMIENMTQATRLKIAQQNQKKTLLGWKQTAYQGISTQLIEFSKKYMDYQSPTNLLSSAFYDQSIVTSVGKNNALVSATGKTNSTVEINGVKDLATSATHNAQGSLKPSDLATSDFDIKGSVTYSKLAGGTMTFQYGKDEYTITLDQNADLSTAKKLEEEINKQLKDIRISVTDSTSSNPVRLGDKISVTADQSGMLKFEVKNDAGNTIKITGASSAVQEALKLDSVKLKDGIDLSKSSFIAETDQNKLQETTPTVKYLTGKSMTLSFNGQEKEITLLTEEEAKTMTSAEEFKKLLQKKLDGAFGSGKIEVQFNPKAGASAQEGSFKFHVKDGNDVLKISKGSVGVVGNGSVLGFQVGDGNRINLNAKLSDLGVDFKDKDKMDLVINGVTIGSYGKGTTLGDIIRDINSNKEAGVKASYSETSNKFVLTSKDTGAGSKVEIGDSGLAKELFGKANVRGTDAVIHVTVNGEKKELTRPTNEIDIDGLKVTISGKFGYDEKTGALKNDETEKVTFTSKPDTEKTFEAIKTMVEDYNKIVESVYKEMTTKPNRDYKPLTDEQKKEMSKEQIEKWEEKAKEGLLFADTQLRSLNDALRFVFNPGGEAGAKLRAMGIEPTGNYKDGGKIKLDESKLKSALTNDAEGVKNAFTALASGQTGEIMNSSSKGGVITQLKGVTDRFASTSITKPGILVARAGSPSSPNSMLKNTMKTEMDSIDKILKNLDVRLKKEIDRYNSQFTKLETLISQMNAQSGQLAGLLGGGM